jgi:hypothetical protein
MKRQLEWAILGGLILFMSFTSGFGPVRAFLSTPVGKAAGLAAVVYVFKYVSAPIGLLLAIHVARCSRMMEGVDETLAEPTEMCQCDPDFTYNSGTKMCEKPGAQSKPPAKCTCIPGETWDDTEKKCKTKPVESASLPPPTAMPPSGGAADLATVQAQAASLPPSSVPETTGSAASAAMASAPPTATPAAPEKFTPMDSPMIRGKQYSPW